ncbi:hypothetical protein MJA45_02460 [Paenibacillus aurantius]|uniref:Uncharacterized protein n=1 Tax=Paenibacillus aurantius TaxID=2918900 RepID=A0AA96LH79_9BACL|nr:hypothetical protein [Paenibacillus aurantius]WNQ11941.1 hypothetical protein MJA45_02460 [Paenibacillus aurantius]
MGKSVGWRQLGSRALVYGALKYAAAGVIGWAVTVYGLFASDFNLYEFSQVTRSLIFWGILLGYAPLYTMAVDGLLFLLPKKPALLKSCLYALGGYLYFLRPFGWGPGWLDTGFWIAGTVGAIIALAYGAAEAWLRSRRLQTKVIAWAAPLLLWGLSSLDYTYTREWQEKSTESGYEASFGYFNGEKRISVEVPPGETVKLELTVARPTEGGWGFRVEDEKGRLVPTKMLREQQYLLTTPGRFDLVLTGDRWREGEVKIRWKKETP